jgi:hypothetical protein
VPTRETSFRTAIAVAVLALPLTSPAWASGPGHGQPPVTEKDFNSANFSPESTTITNRFLPLVPGTQFVLDGTANRGSGSGTHEVIFTVTDVTKWVDHVRTLVIWDRDVQDGVLAEEELSFFAQDKAGNVWYLGENPDVYDNGTVTADATWLAGHIQAIPGLAMRNSPRVGTSSYLQGSAPNAGFLDQATVVKANQKTCVPAGCYKRVLMVDEFDPNQQPQDGHQLKYHAPGVGIVRVEPRGGTEQETLVLSELRHLDATQLAAARDRALALDKLAYQLAPAVWSDTPNAVPLAAP